MLSWAPAAAPQLETPSWLVAQRRPALCSVHAWCLPASLCLCLANLKASSGAWCCPKGTGGLFCEGRKVLALPWGWRGWHFPHPRCCAPKDAVFAFGFLPWVLHHEGASERESREEGKAPAVLLNHAVGPAGAPAPDRPVRCGPFLGCSGKGRTLWSPGPALALGTLLPRSLSLANSHDEGCFEACIAQMRLCEV